MFRFTGSIARNSRQLASARLPRDYVIPAKISPFGLSTNLRWASSSKVDKTTCLIDFHKKRQARLETFAGYLMPIVYKNQTIKNEHMQTRTLASVFDVSHMMQTVIKGRDRYKFIESITVADVENMGSNKCTLSMMTNESGGILDDCIISKRHDHIHLVNNAGNADLVWTWLTEKLEKNAEVELERLVGQGLIALQGPKAADVLQTMVNVKLADLEFMNTLDANIEGVGLCQITRCGYTGEDGFEISVKPENAEDLMEALCKHDDVKPAGLGARDTLRLEAGLCLHGHDITSSTTPIEAALIWTLHKRRRLEGGFPGSERILHQLKHGSERKRVGLVALRSGPPARENCPISESIDGTVIGQVTSGNFAPKLEKNIAMAYLPSNLATRYDHKVVCTIRGKSYEYAIAKMPFVKSNYYTIAKR